MIAPGEKYNNLTILNFSKKDTHYRKYWICKCDCGNIKEIRGDKIISGHTKSCGCLNTQGRINNILGQKFNYLTVIEQTEKRASGGDVIWKCRCDCGNIAFASASSLRNNRIQSCGCLHSTGENEISELLNQNNITFTKEYYFTDLKDKGFLRFDFGIIDKNNNKLKYLIEFDGEIHFKQTGWTKNDHTKIVLHDKMKDEYCIKNNIPLIRIPYYKRHNIILEDLLLDTTSFNVLDKTENLQK